MNKNKVNTKSIMEKMIVPEETTTRLLHKQFSPMIVRKYQLEGWPLFVGLICDIDLSDLDKVVYEAYDLAKEQGILKEGIQHIRNFTGFLSSYIKEHYNTKKKGCVEGIACLYYCDKVFVSALDGDFMVHLSCKLELYSIINTLPHI